MSAAAKVSSAFHGKMPKVHGHTNETIASRRVLLLREPLLRERLLAEFVGTFFLTFTVGVSVVGGGPMAPVAIGLVLAISIYQFGAVSGGMFNPAVTVAVLFSGRYKITPRESMWYVLAQCAAAVVGAAVALLTTEKSFYFSFEETHNFKASFLLELCFTMLLCGIVLSAGTSNDAPNHYFGFAIGLAVTGGAIASGGFDQGSFNPAVTLGINLANYMNPDTNEGPSRDSWLVFLIAPLVGASLAALVFRGTRGNEFAMGVRDVDVEVVVEEGAAPETDDVVEQ